MMSPKSRWEQRWSERATEEANNLNPAFCGELIFRTVTEYKRARQEPLNFALSFLILPIALHKITRDELPGNASAAFAGWVAEHTPLLANLPERVRHLVPVTREALLLLMQHQSICVVEGNLGVGKKRLKLSGSLETTDDADEARRSAGLLGRWFARQREPSLVMQALGVTP